MCLVIPMNYLAENDGRGGNFGSGGNFALTISSCICVSSLKAMEGGFGNISESV